ncbi:hypothetical protein C8R45DRAFT_964165 [Mycena sanguinolenta]|nr:hypothetical protein C8R45DRAFT_964165 [Mycena sanguinolenta]
MLARTISSPPALAAALHRKSTHASSAMQCAELGNCETAEEESPGRLLSGSRWLIQLCSLKLGLRRWKLGFICFASSARFRSHYRFLAMIFASLKSRLQAWFARQAGIHMSSSGGPVYHTALAQPSTHIREPRARRQGRARPRLDPRQMEQGRRPKARLGQCSCQAARYFLPGTRAREEAPSLRLCDRPPALESDPQDPGRLPRLDTELAIRDLIAPRARPAGDESRRT